jgi:Fe2+ transport system protein FeoA
MTLDKARRGSEIEVLSITDPEGKSQLMRMGISEGSSVVCQQKLPFGPVIIRCKRQEIAIGRQLARRIHVK